MKLIIAAPANGTELKNALHAQLAADSRISELRDMSTDASYPQISFAVAQAIAAGDETISRQARTEMLRLNTPQNAK